MALAIQEGRDDRTFSNSLFGMVMMSVFAVLTGAPPLALVKARRRYEEWIKRKTGVVG